MRNETKRRNQLTLYVGDNNIAVLEEFCKLIKLDKEIKELQVSKKPSRLLSIATVSLWDEYNHKNRYKLVSKQKDTETDLNNKEELEEEEEENEE